MSRLVTAGVLLCGVHIANAQTNIDSGYTVLIPSEVTIDKESGKGSFSVSGKMDAQTELDVTTTSQNNYKLKCGSQFVDYTLDKQSFHIDNIKSANPKSFNEDFYITLTNTNTDYSGPYEDRLTFNIVNNAYTYELDLNSVLDGVNSYSVHDYGTADIYINGVKVADNVSDWSSTVHYGDIYEIKDIKGTTGHHYSGVADGWNNLSGFPLRGKIGIDTKHVENSKGLLYSSIFLKFDTNTYTVKYDSNGGTGSMEDTIHKYFKRDDMDGVTKLRKNTFTKIGFKFKGWYMTRTINGEIYYLYDNWQWYKEGTQPSTAKKYLYVDEKTSSNATTVDKDVLTAVAQWEKYANQYVARFHSNGGQLNIIDGSIDNLGNDSNNGFVDVIYTLNASWYWQLGVQANKAGYTCTGYYDAPEGGTKVFDYVYLDNIKQCAGVAVPNTKYFNSDHRWIYENDVELYPHWEAVVSNYASGTLLNINGDEYIIINKEKSEQYLIINKTYIGTSTFQMQYDPSTYLRPDDKYANIYENSTIDQYLENTWYNNLSPTLKNAIIISSIKQNAYSNQKDPNSKQENGSDGQTYNVINRHVFLPSIEELKNLIDLDSPDKVNNFLNGSYMWTRDAYQNSKDGVEFFNYYLGCLLSVPARDTYSVRPAFIIDLSKVNYTVIGTVNYK